MCNNPSKRVYLKGGFYYAVKKRVLKARKIKRAVKTSV